MFSEGKLEASEQGSGSILRVEASILANAVSTPMPNEVAMGEGDALITTIDGDVVMVRKSGIGWSTGKGRKASKKRSVLPHDQVAEARTFKQNGRHV